MHILCECLVQDLRQLTALENYDLGIKKLEGIEAKYIIEFVWMITCLEKNHPKQRNI